MKRKEKLLLCFFSSLALMSCAPSEPGLMTIESGVAGTFVAVGADAQIQLLTQDESSAAPLRFEIRKSDTSGISIGTAIGVEGETPKNESMLFIPASVTKVVTAVMALKALGPDYRFKTEIRWAAGSSPEEVRDPLVIADGDPQTGREDEPNGPARARIKELVQKLKDQGVRRIVGKLQLVSADPRKDLAAVYEGFQPDDFIFCYGAISQSFNYRRNCAGLVVTGLNAGRWNDPNLAFPFKVSLQPAQKANIKVVPQFNSLNVVRSYSIEGDWGRSSKNAGLTLPISESKSWFGNTLLSELTQRGIDVGGLQPALLTAEEERALYSSRGEFVKVVRVESDPMSELIRLMNKPSDNFVADAIFKSLAEKYKDPDIQKASARAVKEGIELIFAQAGKPEWSRELSLLDGSGLTRNNRVTPRAFLTLLKEFSKDPLFPVLWESLPIAGVDGSLKDRMKGTAAEGVARAKTGTLKGAYQLAGYIPKFSADGKVAAFIPFVILSSTTPNNKEKVRDFQDALVARLTKSVNAK